MTYYGAVSPIRVKIRDYINTNVRSIGGIAMISPFGRHTVFFLISALVLIFLAIPSTSPAKEYRVTNTNDSGPGSLSQVIGDLNTSGYEEGNKIVFDIPREPGSTESPSLDISLPEIKKTVKFENAPGRGVKLNSSRIRPFYAYGIYADKGFAVDVLSGDVSGKGIGLFYGNAYGVYSGDSITIGTLSGNVSGLGAAAGLFGAYGTGYGLYAEKDIAIDDLSGTVTGTGGSGALGAIVAGAYASGYGMYAGKNITVGTLSGSVSGSAAGVGVGAGAFGFTGAYASGYGMWAGDNITIGTLSGNVSGTGTAAGLAINFGRLTLRDKYGSAPDTSVATQPALVLGLGFTGAYGSGYGLWAGNDIGIGTLSGDVTGSGNAVGLGIAIGRGQLFKYGGAAGTQFSGAFASGYGLRAGNDIKINTLEGNVRGDGMAIGFGAGAGYLRYSDTIAGLGVGFNGSYGSGYGLYAGNDITVGTLSGNVNGSGTTVGIGLRIGSGVSGYAWGTKGEAVGFGFTGAYGSGYGLYAGNDITVGTLSGNVNGSGTSVALGFNFGRGMDNLDYDYARDAAAGYGVGFTGAYGSGYGLYAVKDMAIGTLSGTVNGSGTAVGLDIGVGTGEAEKVKTGVGAGFTGAYGSGYGLRAGNDMAIGTLSGDVSGTGTAVTVGFGLRTPHAYKSLGVGLGSNGAFGSGYGLYASRDVKIETISGSVTGTGTAIGTGIGISTGAEHDNGSFGAGIGLTGAYGSGYGLYAGRDAAIGTLSGIIGGTGTAVGFGLAFGSTGKPAGIESIGAYGSGYGIYAGNDLAINSLSGSVSGTGTAVGAGIGIGFDSNGAGIGGGVGFSYGSGYGLYAGENLTIASLDGNVAGTGSAAQLQAGYGESTAVGVGAGVGFSYGSGYGLYAGKDINIRSLNGYVTGTGIAISGTLGVGVGEAAGVGAGVGVGYGSGHGMYAGKDITIGTLGGSVEGAGFALDLAMGVGAGFLDGVGVGAASGLSYGSGYGIHAGGNLAIVNLSGTVYGSGEAVGGALGAGPQGVGVGGGAGSGYGLHAGENIAIDTLSGNVTGNGFALSMGMGTGAIPAGVGGGDGSGYGLYAGKDITIDTLSGNVNANGTDVATGVVGLSSTSGYGLYAGRNITIGTLSGNVKGHGMAIGAGAGGVGRAVGYGLYGGENIKIDTLSGTVSASATTAGGIIGAGSASAYGIYAGKDISVRIMSGDIKAESNNYWFRVPGLGNNAYGVYAKGALNGGSPEKAAFISGTVSASASGDAIAVRSDGPMNIYVIGTLNGVDMSWFSWFRDDGYAIYGGKGDDIVSLDTGATINGKIDLGKGNNTLNLYGSNSLNSYFTNITNFNVGDGTRGAFWSLDTGASGSSFKSASINPYSILAVNTDVRGGVDVRENAALIGSGTITGDVTNNGILMPYNRNKLISSDNRLTIYGNYTHNPDALFMVRANERGKADRLVVAKPHWYSWGQGVATLKGGTVSVLADTGTYEKDTKYTILTANKVDGTFKNAETNLAFLDPSLNYDSKNVYLTLTRNGRLFSDVAQTANQRNVARIFEKAEQDKNKIPVPQDRTKIPVSQDKQPLGSLESLSAQGAKSAYDRLAGYNHTAAASAGFSQFNRYMDVMKDRAHAFLTGSPGSSFANLPIMGSRTDMGASAPTMLLAQLNALEAADQPIVQPKWGFFARGYGGFGETRQNDISSRYDQATSGFVMGFDSKVSSSFLMGATMGYSYTKLGMDALTDTAYVKGHQASVYAVYSHGPVYVNGILGYGYNDYDTTRQLAFSSSDRIAQASYAGHIASGYVETGYRFTGRYMDVIPLAGIQGSYLLRDGFSESGANTLALSVDSQSYSSLVSSLGVRLRKEIALETGTMIPEVKLRWDHEFADNTYGMNASFTGYPGASFTVTPDRPDRDRLVAGVSLIRQGTGNLSLYLSYEGTYSANDTMHMGGMGLKWRW
jgi:uncharacterized protein with beta-barrel porin domain